MSLDVDLLAEYCPHCGRGDEVFSADITHNLNAMAEEAGIYELVWRPEEVPVGSASDLIGPLQAAIAEMERNPDRFRKHNAPNGWGLYEHFVPWLRRYLAACEQYPDAIVKVSR